MWIVGQVIAKKNLSIRSKRLDSQNVKSGLKNVAIENIKRFHNSTVWQNINNADKDTLEIIQTEN